MLRTRTAIAAAIVSVAFGCGRPTLPARDTAIVFPASSTYPVRTDLLVVAVPSGTPPRWPSPGTSPIASLRRGAHTPDADFAAQLRPALGKSILDSQAVLSDLQRDDLQRLLDRYFGTPSAPRVLVPEPTAAEKLALYEFDPNKGAFFNLRRIFARYADWLEAEAARIELGLVDERALAHGGVLYRRWCAGCHGHTGGGDGAHAVAIGASPRDYRQGTFKFGSSFPGGDKPRKGERGKLLKSDIARTIRCGLDGSMMPPFPQLSDADIDVIASYVIHLSARGEVEFEVMVRVIRLLTNPNEDDPEYSVAFLEQTLDLQSIFTVGNWGRAGRAAIAVPPEETDIESQRWESAVRGYKAFAARGCLGCHDNYGRTTQLKYDAWGTVVQPRNLTLGVFRGGRRGEDLYARVYCGIVPSTMPDFSANLKNVSAIEGRPDEVWDIVHFLQALGDARGRAVLVDRLRIARERDPSLTIIPFD